MTIIIMGVSGCGKSTVGRALAELRSSRFLDADDFHPRSNIDKMSKGIPLSDADRWPWLDILAKEIQSAAQAGTELVLACSALKQAYRERLATGGTCRFVHLSGSRELLATRLGNRPGHFMASSLLDSQLATLESPAQAITVDIALPLPKQLAAIQGALAQAG